MASARWLNNPPFRNTINMTNKIGCWLQAQHLSACILRPSTILHKKISIIVSLLLRLDSPPVSLTTRQRRRQRHTSTKKKNKSDAEKAHTFLGLELFQLHNHKKSMYGK